jgi:hypothetical protein
MKIGPEPLPPVPARPAPPAAEPARPFAEFLADTAARAAAFAELGMFGRNRAQSGPGPAPAATGNPGDPPPLTRTLPALPEDGTATQLARVNRSAPAPLPSSRPPPCDLPDAPSIKAKPAETCSLPTEAPGRTRGADRRAGPAGSARSSTPRARPRQDAPRTAINLALRETDGAVEIVAGAPPIDPEARVQLRRLVEAILARSGLALAQFQLNGAPLAPDNLGKTGGTHGTRTR